MSRFKIGDKVKCIDEVYGLTLDKVYEIKKVFPSGMTQIENDFLETINYYSARFHLLETFQVNDKVKIKGGQDVWTVTDVNGSYDINIRLNAFSVNIFPNSIELVERPKKLVKKQFQMWMNVNPGGDNDTFDSAEDADKMAATYRLACVKLTGEAEVPEDYND